MWHVIAKCPSKQIAARTFVFVGPSNCLSGFRERVSAGLHSS